MSFKGADVKYIHWLDMMGLGETMKIIVDGAEEPALDDRSATLYLPNPGSVWWKV